MIVKVKGARDKVWHIFDGVDEIEYDFETRVLTPEQLEAADYDLVIQSERHESPTGIILELNKLDEDIRIFFDTHAFICNDEGKKIQKLNG